jgi:thioredoxin 1
MSELIIEVSDQTFEEVVLSNELPVLVDFWAPWCGPCLALTPVLTQLAGEYQGKVCFTKMNVDENAIIPAEYAIRSIPSLFLVKNGQVIDSLVGNHPKDKIKAFIDQAVV